MPHNKISFLFIEASGQWKSAAVSLFGRELNARTLQPDSWTGDDPFSDWIAIEYSVSCLEKWFSLFDKSPENLENRTWILLNAPPELMIRNQLFELGFTGFVNDMVDLRHEIERYLTVLDEPPLSNDLRDQLTSLLAARLSR